LVSLEKGFNFFEIGSHYVAQAGLELLTLCCNCSQALICSSRSGMGFTLPHTAFL
jgi:hypothetical protein